MRNKPLRSIIRRKQNPFRKWSFHNDVETQSRGKIRGKNYTLARKLMDNYTFPDEDIPNLKGTIQWKCCDLLSDN